MARRFQQQHINSAILVVIMTLITFGSVQAQATGQAPMSEPFSEQDFVGNKIIAAANSTNPVDLPTSKSPIKETGDSLLGFVSNVLPSKQHDAARSKSKAAALRNKTSQDTQEKAGLFDEPPAGSKTVAPNQKRRDPIDLNQTLKKVGSATALVLVGCCAFLVVAKKLGVGQGGAKNSSQGSRKASINILETRRLAGRCQLKLIEVDDCRFLVAVDGGGVKSVQAVTKSFTASLDEIERATTTESRVEPTNETSPETFQPKRNERGTPSDISERLTSLIERI